MSGSWHVEARLNVPSSKLDPSARVSFALLPELRAVEPFAAEVVALVPQPAKRPKRKWPRKRRLHDVPFAQRGPGSKGHALIPDRRACAVRYQECECRDHILRVQNSPAKLCSPPYLHVRLVCNVVRARAAAKIAGHGLCGRLGSLAYTERAQGGMSETSSFPTFVRTRSTRAGRRSIGTAIPNACRSRIRKIVCGATAPNSSAGVPKS